MKTVGVGNKIVGDGHPAYVIAEAGINHNGDVSLAKTMIQASCASGMEGV